MKVYLLQSTCETIRKAMEEKHLSYKEVAKLVDSSASTIFRICTGKTRSINLDLAQKIEISLDVLISNALDDSKELIKRIEELENENKLLKQLLIEKWS